MKPCLGSQNSPSPPKCYGELLAEWQHLVTTLKRSIYTSGKVPNTEGKKIPESLVAFLGVQGQQERSSMLSVGNVQDESWEHLRNTVGIGMVQIRLCGRPRS